MPTPRTVCTASLARNHSVAALGRILRLAVVTALVVAFLCRPAAAASGAPASLPGPPPGAGTGFPAAPSPGTVPTAGGVGPAASLPSGVSGPGLLSGIVQLQGRKLTLAIACSAGGAVSLTAPALHSGVLARGGYVCRRRRASVQLSLSGAAAGRLRALGSTLASVTLGGQHPSIMLEASSAPPSDWSDGGLECSFLGPYEPYLVAPNFTVSPAVVIDVRPWVAWYTGANGWRWLGTSGVNSSTWYRWTATPTGVAQWVTPTGALNPWTWAPISVSPGQHASAIGVFEVIYWYAHPRYKWAYTRSRLNASALGAYCMYP